MSWNCRHCRVWRWSQKAGALTIFCPHCYTVVAKIDDYDGAAGQPGLGRQMAAESLRTHTEKCDRVRRQK